MSGKLHGTAALTPDKVPRYALNWMLSGLQSLYGRFRVGKYFLCLPEIGSRIFQDHSLVTRQIAVSRLHITSE